MILAIYRHGTVALDGRSIDIAASPEEEARIRELLTKPAVGRQSVAGDDGLIAEEFVEIAPGSTDHFRAVVQSLDDVALLVDDEA